MHGLILPAWLLAMVFVISVFGAEQSQAQTRSLERDLAPLGKELDRMGAEFCNSLKIKCTSPKRKKTKATSSKPRAVTKPRSKPAAPAKAPAPAAAAVSEPPPPLPRTKPQPEPVPAPPTPPEPPAQEVTVEKPPSPPLPRPKPATPVADTPPPPQPPPAQPLSTDCLIGLRGDGATFVTAAQPNEGAQCIIDTPVRLQSLATTSGAVRLPEEPLLSCPFARQFARWIAESGAALVRTHSGMSLAAIATGPGFDCRGRNGDTGTKLSEHGKGQAVDIASFSLENGTRIEVADAQNSASRFFTLLRGLRTSACGYFTTVLGPGSNAAHASHFHFDIGKHGKSDNYRICE